MASAFKSAVSQNDMHDDKHDSDSATAGGSGSDMAAASLRHVRAIRQRQFDPGWSAFPDRWIAMSEGYPPPGRLVLLWCADGDGMSLGAYDRSFDQFDQFGRNPIEPTHWRPAPAPPKDRPRKVDDLG
jgi:hypothetical protein